MTVGNETDIISVTTNAGDRAEKLEKMQVNIDSSQASLNLVYKHLRNTYNIYAQFLVIAFVRVTLSIIHRKEHYLRDNALMIERESLRENRKVDMPC